MPSCLGRDIILLGMLIYPGLSAILSPTCPFYFPLCLVRVTSTYFLLSTHLSSFTLCPTPSPLTPLGAKLASNECPPSSFVWGPRFVSGNLGKGFRGMLYQLLNSLLSRVFMWSSASWVVGTQTPSRGHGTGVHCTCLLLKNKNKWKNKKQKTEKHLSLCTRAQSFSFLSSRTILLPS